jgi:hypothetical protein
MSARYFPESYRDGRTAFLAAAGDRGLSTITRVHPSRLGRDGKPLFLDTVALGPRGTETALLVISGMHGVEGYFGSGVLTTALRENWFAGCSGRIVLLHALNPFGFSFDRRTDENNVDVNRNFIDHTHPPDNCDYAALAKAIALSDLSYETMAASDAALAGYAERSGPAQLQAALALGQYTHEAGLCYGGHALCWSATAIFDVLKEELKGARRLIVLDLHTGLGDFATGQIVCDDPIASSAFARAKAIWPHVTASASGEAVAPPAYGLPGPALAARVNEVTFATLEIGTLPLPDVFSALRKDLWLHCVAGEYHSAAAAIAAEMRAAFFPADPSWREAAMQTARAATAAALPALGYSHLRS